MQGRKDFEIRFPRAVSLLLFFSCLILFQVRAMRGSRSSATLSLDLNASSGGHHDDNPLPQPQTVSTAGQTATPAAAPSATSSSSGNGCPREYSEPLPPDLSGRKFLMLAVIKEQMSKARLHLSETMALARLLNRTLILPQVAPAADSIRYDHPHPACAYFDVERIGEMVPWVTQSYFLEQVERAERAGRPISTKTIMRHQPHELCGRENESWKVRKFRRSLFSRDMEDEKAERVICVRNKNSAVQVTLQQRILKALEEGGDADVLVLVKFTFSIDVYGPPIRVRFKLHGLVL